MIAVRPDACYLGTTPVKEVRKGTELVLAPRGEELWYKANEIPSLDLRFAATKSLVDATTGTNLVTFARGSSGTYVGSDGLIKTATTNEPRFTHDPVTGESLGLLVEEQRVNLLQRTEEFDNAVWNKIRTTITSNAAIAPDGTLTADFVAPSTDNDSHLVSQLVSTAASKTYARSVFAKAAGYSQLTVRIAGSGWASTGSAAYVNLQTGAVTGPNPELLIVQRFPNNWFRISSSATTDATTSSNRGILIAITQEDNISFTGDPTKGIYLWGGDMEEGAFATSYIKNVDNPLGATRAADVASISGSNFSSWYNASEGTVYAQGTSGARYSGTNTFPRIAEINNSGSTNDAISMTLGVLAGNTDMRLAVRVGGIGQTDAFLTTNTQDNGKPFALAYKANSFAAATTNFITTDSTGALPTVNQLYIGGFSSASSGQFNGPVKRIAYWPQRLSNEVLQVITQ